MSDHSDIIVLTGDDRHELLQVLTMFSKEQPLVVSEAMYDTLEKRVLVGELAEHMERIVVNHYMPLTGDELDGIYKIYVKENAPKKAGPWPPQHPRSPRKR